MGTDINIIIEYRMPCHWSRKCVDQENRKDTEPCAASVECCFTEKNLLNTRRNCGAPTA